jgi:transposase-like protein
MPRKNNVYSVELKRKVVEEYLSGETSTSELCKKYNLKTKGRVYEWVKKYSAGDLDFKDNRGLASPGRKPKIKPISQMTKDEYIEYLELENKILKGFAEMLDKKKK